MTLFLTDTEREQLRADLERAEHLAREHVRILAGCRATLAEPPVDMLAPSYYPERMGYLYELRVGDRVLFAGGWREVATWFEHTNGAVTVTFTDPDMDALVDKGTHSIRIQKAGAYADRWTRWSDGFDPAAQGVTVHD